MARRDGPGVWWQLLEFMGMTWPGRKTQAAAPAGPRCPACGNPSQPLPGGGFACPHHPHARLSDPSPHP